MSMLEQRIQQQFFESADLQYQSADTLARQVAEAAQALLTAITAGGKVLICGSGWGVSLADHFEALLVGGFERERPPLAALALQGSRASTAQSSSMASQVRALAHPGDVLVALVCGKNDAEVLAAADAARARECTLVVFGGDGGDGDTAQFAAWRERLTETDVMVAVPHERAARRLEFQLLALHSLCDALDLQLLGELEP